MRLATFSNGRVARPGVIVGDRILQVPYASMLELIAGGKTALARIADIAGDFRPDDGYALDSVTLHAPIPRPAKNVFCVGRNYRLHIEEGARAHGIEVKFPPVPEFFSKPPTTVIGTGADVRLPAATEKLDYEVELGIVMGRNCRDVSEAGAPDCIFGYMVVNDITARDLQRAHGQWFKGKGLDTTCPTGPWIVTADEFDASKSHRLWLSVNGERRQDSVTSDMLFNCAQIVESLSSGMTLEAGDIIATGTPSGVGMGLSPQIWLRDGDVVEAGIDGIGSIVNTVRAA
ncbi:MAG: fumarylacetoacetate hydrolase family protein [Pseudomonadota bacterium]